MTTFDTACKNFGMESIVTVLVAAMMERGSYTENQLEKLMNNTASWLADDPWDSKEYYLWELYRDILKDSSGAFEEVTCYWMRG